MNHSSVVELERGFWSNANSPPYYALHMHEDGLMVLPGMGVLDRASTINAIASADPWDGFELQNVRTQAFRGDIVVLTYAAHAKRGPTTYGALVTSVFLKCDDDAWRLILHQQTPGAF